MNEEQFTDFGIKLQWMDYSGYSEYPQFHTPFENGGVYTGYVVSLWRFVERLFKDYL